MEPLIDFLQNFDERDLSIVPDKETLSLVKEYCYISSLKRISEREADRLAEILSIADENDCLEFWINEADHFMAHELGLSGEAIHPIETVNQRAELLEHLDFWSKKESALSEEASILIQEIKQFLIEESRKAQKALQKRGFYKGDIDGVIGPMTKDAISSFKQSDSGSTEDIDDAAETVLGCEI